MLPKNHGTCSCTHPWMCFSMGMSQLPPASPGIPPSSSNAHLFLPTQPLPPVTSFCYPFLALRQPPSMPTDVLSTSQTAKRWNFGCQTLLHFGQRHGRGCSLITGQPGWHSSSLESIFAEKRSREIRRTILTESKTTQSGHTEVGSLNRMKRRKKGQGGPAAAFICLERNLCFELSSQRDCLSLVSPGDCPQAS